MPLPCLVALRCLTCSREHWTIQNSVWPDVKSAEHPDPCPGCGTVSAYEVCRTSPPHLFSQPNPMQPMDAEEFEQWVAVLRTHFPHHPWLEHVWERWFPIEPIPEQGAVLAAAMPSPEEGLLRPTGDVATPVANQDGDGFSLERAAEGDGRQWLTARFPGWIVRCHRLVMTAGGPVHCFTINSGKESRHIYIKPPVVTEQMLPRVLTGPPCPYCGEPLRTDRAKQCGKCGMDWHNPEHPVQRRGSRSTRASEPGA